MIDSHCHLADEAFADDLDAVIGRARTAGLSGALCILSAGDDKESAAAARRPGACGRRSASRSASTRTRRGSSPAGSTTRVPRAARASLSEGARAIGEIGLDYHYDFSPRDVQQAVFRTQVGLALELALPVVIHTREATDDTFGILRDAGPSLRGVFHCLPAIP